MGLLLPVVTPRIAAAKKDVWEPPRCQSARKTRIANVDVAAVAAPDITARTATDRDVVVSG
jgi:hypothetical protein